MLSVAIFAALAPKPSFAASGDWELALRNPSIDGYQKGYSSMARCKEDDGNSGGCKYSLNNCGSLGFHIFMTANASRLLSRGDAIEVYTVNGKNIGNKLCSKITR